MRAAGTVTASIRLEVEIDETKAGSITSELRHIVDETGLSGSVSLARRPSEG
jgi:hypothetical protein